MFTYRNTLVTLSCLAALTATCAAQETRRLRLTGPRLPEGTAAARNAIFTVWADAAVADAVTISWQTEDGTALAGADYTAAQGQVVLPAGAQFVDIPVVVKGDTVAEMDESFSMRITAVSSGQLETAVASAVVENDDWTDFYRIIAPATVLESAAVAGTVTLSTIAAEERRFSVALRGAEAVAGEDFPVQAVAVTIPPGALSGSFSLPLTNDSERESPERLFITAKPLTPGLKPGSWSSEAIPVPAGQTPRTSFSGGVTQAVETITGVHLFRQQAAGGWTLEKSLPSPGWNADGAALSSGVFVRAAGNGRIEVFERDFGGSAQWGRAVEFTVQGAYDYQFCLHHDTLAVWWGNTGELGAAGTGVSIRERHRGGWNAWGEAAFLQAPAGSTRDFFGGDATLYGHRLVASARAWSGGLTPTLHVAERAPGGMWQLTGAALATPAGSLDAMSTGWDGDAVTMAVRTINPSLGDLWSFRRFLPAAGSNGGWAASTAFSSPASIRRAGGAVTGTSAAFTYANSAQAALFYPSGNQPAGQATVPTTYPTTEQMRWLRFDSLSSRVATETALLTPGEVALTLEDDENPLITVQTPVYYEPDTISQAVGGITLTLSESLTAPATLTLRASSGTAVEGSDFLAVERQVTIPAGYTQHQVTAPFTLLGDALTESDETIIVSLSGLSRGTAGSPVAMTLRDLGPRLSVPQPDIWEDDNPDAPGTLTVALSKPASVGLPVNYFIAHYSPSPGSVVANAVDMAAASGTITVPPGAMFGQIPVRVFADTIVEGNERFWLQISGGYYGGFNTDCRVLNDDVPVLRPDSYALTQGQRLEVTAASPGPLLLTSNDTGDGNLVLEQPPDGAALILNNPAGTFQFTPHPNTRGAVTFSYSRTFTAAFSPGPSAWEWRWLHPLDGMDPGTARPDFHSRWFLPEFDDSAWNTGPPAGNGAVFSDSRQPVAGVPDTAYLRLRIRTTPGLHTVRTYSWFDDGAILYLGGREISRAHRTPAPNFLAAPDSFDLRVGPGETFDSTPWTFGLTQNFRTQAQDVLAVSVHNAAVPEPAGSDAYFKLQILELTDSRTLPVQVTVDISDAGLPPVLEPDSLVANEFQPVSLNLYANDSLFRADGTPWDDLLDAEIIGTPPGGHVVSFNKVSGIVIYQPDEGFIGDAAFAYRVRDKDGWSTPAEVTLRFTATLPVMPIRALEPLGTGSAGSLRNFARLEPGAALSAPVMLEAGQTVSLRTVPPALSATVTVRIEQPDGTMLISAPWTTDVPVDRVPCRQTGRHRLRFVSTATVVREISWDLVCGAMAAKDLSTALASARTLTPEPAGARQQRAAVVSKIIAAPSSTARIVGSDNFNSGTALSASWTTWQSDPAATIGIGTEGAARGLAMQFPGTTPMTCEATLAVNPGAVSNLSLSCRYIMPTNTVSVLPVTVSGFTGHIPGEAISVSTDGNKWFVAYNSLPQAPINLVITASLAGGLASAGWTQGQPFFIRWQQTIVAGERFLLDDVVISGVDNGSDWWKFILTAPQTVELHAAPLSQHPVALAITTGAGIVQSTASSNGSAPCSIRQDLAAGTWFVRAQGPQNTVFHLALLTGTAQEARRAAGNAIIEPLSGTQSAWAGHLAPAATGAVRAAYIADHGYSPDPASNNARVAAMVRSWQPDFIVSGGDTNYGTDISTWETNVGAFYGSFMQRRTDGLFPLQTSAMQRFFPSVGNHDADQQRSRLVRDYLDYYHRNPGGAPRLPLDSGAEQNENSSFYRFQRGAAEFLMVDSEHAVSDTAYRDRQRAWLNRHLPVGTARWRFSVIHHPPYSSGSVHGSQTYTQWNEWRAADAVISGDDHVYERLAMRDTLGLICGTGGASLYSFNAALPETQFRYNAFHGALLITADSESARIEMRSLDDGANGANGGTVVDTIQLGEPSTTTAQPDEFTLPLTAGQRVILRTLTPPDATGAPNLLDPRIELLNFAGTLLASDDSSAGDGRNALLTWESPDAGNVRIRLSRTTPSGGDYRMLLNPPFDVWLADNVSLPTERTASADSDGDSLSQLMEYALGTLPGGPDSGAVLPVPVSSAGNTALEIELANPQPADILCELETGSLTGSWQATARLLPGAAWTGGISAEEIPAQRGGRRYRLTMTAPLSVTGGRLFARLRVSIF